MPTLKFAAPTDLQSPIVRVSDLRQWTYCPRVVWWTHVCPVGKVESFKMKLGLCKEQRLQRLQKRRTLKSFGLRQGQVQANVSLHSAQLGLCGKVDMLIHQGLSRYPVEIKFTQGAARLNHKLQLAGYAILLESIYGSPVPYGYVVCLPEDTVDRIEIDPDLRNLAWQTIQAIRRTLHLERIPPPVAQQARCVDCEYFHFCGDIERNSP